QYYNKEVKIEETTIPYDTVFVITNFISVSIDENLIDYIHNSVDDEGNSTYIYDFYLCGDEVVFIHNIDMV
ncbi:MAG: hypothetical protein GX352_02685, partial [Clostridiales bacterium]|nr:hypothetical protein [Clostridiales bacterium]